MFKTRFQGTTWVRVCFLNVFEFPFCQCHMCSCARICAVGIEWGISLYPTINTQWQHLEEELPVHIWPHHDQLHLCEHRKVCAYSSEYQWGQTKLSPFWTPGKLENINHVIMETLKLFARHCGGDLKAQDEQRMSLCFNDRHCCPLPPPTPSCFNSSGCERGSCLWMPMEGSSMAFLWITLLIPNTAQNRKCNYAQTPP